LVAGRLAVAQERAKWIDQLLDSDAYARHWARSWRDTAKAVEAPFGEAHGPAFKAWLSDQLKQNRNNAIAGRAP
jgi:hypothetical protein